ncbi:MAG: carboxymuconolactone decarboxylase family protein [Planctomycetes bacterium]|nr:carboxymuconolactone decarboxylase family protein [Planctomycetota bacterium]
MPIAKRLEGATLSFLLTGLDPLKREDAMLAICAAITADGHAEHAGRAFEFLLKEKDRPDPEAMREAVLQTHLFGGYPRALNALAAFKNACKKVSNPLSGEIRLRDEPLEGDDLPAFRQRGQKLFNLIYGENAPRIDRFARGNSPDLGDWALAEGYGRVLSRPGLEFRQRSLCIVAALIPLDVAPQLKGHVLGALNTGSTKEQLWRLYDVICKLFKEGAELNAAKGAFEEALGKPMKALDNYEEEREWRGF